MKRSSFWHGKRVLVTGGTGFIGSHVAEVLVAEDATVTVVGATALSQQQVQKRFGKAIDRVHVVTADLRDGRVAEKTVRGQDIVMHFAALDGSSTFKKSHQAEILKTNSMLTVSVLDACKKADVSRVMMMSSTDVYDKRNPTAREDDDVWDIDAPGYVWSKRFTEIASTVYARQYGTNVRIVRAGNVYGPYDTIRDGDNLRIVPLFVSQAIQTGEISIWGNPDTHVQLMYVEDFAHAVVAYVELDDAPLVMNICGREPASLSDLARSVFRILGKKEAIRYDSSHAPAVRWRVDTTRMEALSTGERHSLLEGLEKYIEYYRHNNP